MKLRVLLLTIVLSTGALLARANNTNPPGADMEGKKIDIAGGVVHADTKKPIGNVNVIAYSANKKEKAVVTDGNGNYYFNELKPGVYKLVFEKDGFKKVTRERVTIRADYGCQLNVEMDEADEFQILPGLLFTDFEK